MTSASQRALRNKLILAMRHLESERYNVGASGNLSVRQEDEIWITPSGVEPRRLRPGAIVRIDLQGNVRTEEAHLVHRFRPSSEWRLHRDLYAARSDLHAIVHTHSCYATALACCRKDIPAFHYMVAIAGGDSIRCAKYATFGTQALSDAVCAAMEGRQACLLANHGMLAAGVDLDAALALVAEVEQLAAQYLLSGLAGGAVALTQSEMTDALAQFTDYRQKLSHVRPICKKASRSRSDSKKIFRKRVRANARRT